MRWLGAACASAILCAIAMSGEFVPMRDASYGIEYLFVGPSLQTMLTAVVAVIAAIATTHLGVIALARRIGPRRSQQLPVTQTGEWARPLALLGVVSIGVLPALPGMGERFAPLGYLFYDMRWWWVGILLLLTAARIERSLGGPIAARLRAVARWTPASRLLLIDGALFTVVVLWAVVTTPYLRFTGVLHGDEPRYVRYTEIWYQGGALDITDKVPFEAWPLDAAPEFWRLPGHVARGIARDATAMIGDVRAWMGNREDFKWNRATGSGAAVTGKNGGVYQLHMPGLGAVLFPGYLLDRALLSADVGYRHEFPAGLWFTNAMMLFVYGACAVALFRLLRHALASDVVAALWAGVAMIVLPATAFAFQLYPELPGLFLITVILTYLLFHHDRASRAAAIIAGASAGSLAWFHPRFLVVAVVLGAVGLFRMRERWPFAIACGFVLGSVAALDYHITGSWSLTALYEVGRDVDAFRAAAVRDNVLGYVFDRRYGILANAPILLLAVPGLAVIARRNAAHAAILVAVGLALLIPAAGHSLTAASGTPGRLVLAVVPLFIWPVAALTQRFWSSPVVRTIAVSLAVLSIETGRAYNWTHRKHMGPIEDLTLSGWRPDLAFPVIRGDGWNSPANLTLLVGLAGLLVGASVLAFLRARAPREQGPPIVNALSPVAMTVAALAVAFTLGSRPNDAWFYDRYLVPGATAYRGKTHPSLARYASCTFCFRSAGEMKVGNGQ